MGILNLIIASAAQATFAWASEESATAPQAPLWHEPPTSWVDLAITVVICITICISLCILAKCIKDIISNNQEKNHKNQTTENNTVKSSEEKEDVIKIRDRYDAAWRFFNMCWKVQHPDPVKTENGNIFKCGNKTELTPEDDKRYAEAWKVVRKYIGVENTKEEVNK